MLLYSNACTMSKHADQNLTLLWTRFQVLLENRQTYCQKLISKVGHHGFREENSANHNAVILNVLFICSKNRLYQWSIKYQYCQHETMQSEYVCNHIVSCCFYLRWGSKSQYHFQECSCDCRAVNCGSWTGLEWLEYDMFTWGFQAPRRQTTAGWKNNAINRQKSLWYLSSHVSCHSRFWVA